MIDDLRKNGSGYYDETAYKAIKNTMKNPEFMYPLITLLQVYKV